jgi:alpha-L-fucosidase
MRIHLFSLLFMALNLIEPTLAQHNFNHEYIPPKDPLVQEKLAQWQDLKLGLMMHWGTYSIWGIVESWSLCPEDEGWTVRRGPYANDWYEYKKAYEALPQQFNPVKFDPDKWATAAKEAGMKYLVFTTKHHDGFSMFDTHQSEYKITNSAFKDNPKANIAKEIFSSFRKQDFMIGAYFSKPDWNTPDYWWRYFPPKDRNVSYDPKKYPEKWQAFKDFTYRQIEELMTEYGKMDILWLDGGWVRPFSTIDPSVDWQKSIPYDQDIDMPRIAAMARRNQPGLLVVDRTVTGEFENYVTPEQQIPPTVLNFPWETCMTMAGGWGHVPNDRYKPSRKLIHILSDVVAKGGSLLLNIGPSPEGEWDADAYSRLKELGAWMKVNGEAIYGTRATNPYKEGEKWRFTAKGKDVYALYLADEGEAMLQEMTLDSFRPKAGTQVYLLGNPRPLAWRMDGEHLRISVPAAARTTVANQPAWVFKITP